MSSLYDELAGKLERDPRLTKRGGARYDLGLLLFDFRGQLHELWEAAAADAAAGEADGRPSARLAAAVEALRPLFGERGAA